MCDIPFMRDILQQARKEFPRATLVGLVDAATGALAAQIQVLR
jgi:hypothetical protein